MERIITLKSNKLDKSIEIKNLVTEKLIIKGFKVIDYLDEDTELIISIGGYGSFLKTIFYFSLENSLTNSLPQISISFKIGNSFLPKSVSEYSTIGGT